jgi:hypothetical protein
VRLFFLEAADYTVEEPADVIDTPTAPSSTVAPFDPGQPMISLSAITGIRAADTMQLKVQIGNHNFTALLDSRSTHNFIGTAAAKHAGLHFHDNSGAHVVVANGDRVA